MAYRIILILSSFISLPINSLFLCLFFHFFLYLCIHLSPFLWRHYHRLSPLITSMNLHIHQRRIENRHLFFLFHYYCYKLRLFWCFKSSILTFQIFLSNNQLIIKSISNKCIKDSSVKRKNHQTIMSLLSNYIFSLVFAHSLEVFLFICFEHLCWEIKVIYLF